MKNLLTILTVLAAVALKSLAADKPVLPHIVFILADDTGIDAKWYACDDGWKLNQSGELFDMKDAPFEEKAVATDAQAAEAKAARQRLQAVLDQLNPTAGKTAPSPDKPAKRVQRQNNRLKVASPN